MTFPDIIVISVYFAISLFIAFWFSKKAGRSSEDFFLSGRKLPWWIAGTTMVATTFGADTPLAVTELVAQKGIAGNWLWWNMIAGNVLTVFFFAKLWRRAEILTDVEFIEIRYSGKPAAFLRGFKAVYLGVFMNAVIMGWVNVALAEILQTVFGVGPETVIFYVFGAMFLVGIYSAISGLWGIAYTDIFQFATAMVGCIILAYVLLDLPEIGGIAGLKKALPEGVFSFFPSIGNSAQSAASGIMILSFSAFTAHIFVQWWASWYPGGEPGGGGYVAQRMMSAKDERHSVLATLWFTVAHYALRPWPWIIVALVSLVLYPDLPADQKKTGFILCMKDHLPAGLLGLLVAAFLAAYMSTISTHLNWGSSYLINDLYRRFIRKNESEKHYVKASRIATIILMVISTLLVFVIKTISGAWAFIIECGAGLGLVLILRWYWWRINAWAEITAMIAPFVGFTLAKYVLHIEFPVSMFFIVGLTTVAWIFVTFVTSPVEEGRLREFYKRVKPGGPGWKKYSGNEDEENLVPLFVNWIAGVVFIYLCLFSIGRIVLKEYISGFILAGIASAILVFLLLRMNSRKNIS